MKIIYHCYGGAHSSVTAANIHLGNLPRDRVPRYEELTGQYLFDRHKVKDTGKMIFMGRDHFGNDIYVVGRRSRPNLLCNVISGLSEIFLIDKKSYMLVDVSPCVNFTMKVGGVLSRRMGLITPGRPIVTWGTRRNYKKLLAEVEKVFSWIDQKIPPGKDRQKNFLLRSPEVEYN